MDDTELYMLTPILQSLVKIDDVREIIKSIVFEDKVRYLYETQPFLTYLFTFNFFLCFRLHYFTCLKVFANILFHYIVINFSS
jgi:hypothetical protein